MPHFLQECWIPGFLNIVLPSYSDKFIKLTLTIHFNHVILDRGILFHLRIVCVVLKVPKSMWISADSRLCIVMNFFIIRLVKDNILIAAIDNRFRLYWLT